MRGQMYMQGPGSVPGPGSVHGQVYYQSPGSVGHGSIQGMGQTSGPGSVQPGLVNNQVPPAPQPVGIPTIPSEELDQMIQDPYSLTQSLIEMDLRHAIVELNKKTGAILRYYKIHDETKTEPYVPPKREFLQYERAYVDFTATLDDIERAMRTEEMVKKQMVKLGTIFVNKPTGTKPDMANDHTAGLMNRVTNFMDETRQLQQMFDDPVRGVTATMKKIRKRQKKYDEIHNNISPMATRMEHTAEDEPTHQKDVNPNIIDENMEFILSSEFDMVNDLNTLDG